MYFWQRRSAMNMPDIERARNLIPGFLKKMLGADDSEWIAQFLNTLRSTGSPAAAEFEQEIAWVERTQLHLAQTSPVFDAQAGWQRMQGRLDASANAAPAAAPSPLRTAAAWVKSQFRARLDKAIRWWQKPAVAAMASAMLIGQMGLLAAVVRYTYNVEPQTALVAPAAGEKSNPDSMTLAVVFKDKATLKQMRQLLDSVQAQVVGGPGAIGVWEVAVPKDKVNEAMKVFSASNIVESAAPQ
jgi:hypothetical protein